MMNMHSFTGDIDTVRPRGLTRTQMQIILAILGFKEEDNERYVPKRTQMHIFVTRQKFIRSLEEKPTHIPQPVMSDPRLRDEKFRSKYLLN